MPSDAAKPWLDNVVVADDEAITIWYCGKPWSAIPWDQVETVSVDVDPFVSGPRPCEAFWMISGRNRLLRVYMRQAGVDELNRRLAALPGFDHAALRRALEAEAACSGGDFLCWRR
jgi:hypothetical protein